MPHLTRRRFIQGLQGLGALAVAAPYLQARAQAEGERPFKRLILWFTPNGTIHNQWRSTTTDTLTFGQGAMLEPLSAQRDRLLLCDQIDFHRVSNHSGGMANMLTGGGRAGNTSGGRSVDQFIAQAIGGQTPFASLELGVHTSAWGGNTQTRMCYREAGEFAPPDDDPQSVYRRIFGGAAGGDPVADRLLARRRSILDINRGELSRLRRRMSAERGQILDQHLEALRTVERRLEGVGGCGQPDAPAGLALRDNDSFPLVGAAQMDLAVAALACGVTSVVSLQWSHTVSPIVFTWIGQRSAHHSLSHYSPNDASGVADYVACERWYAEQFGALLDALAARPSPEGAGTLLDDTLVVWVRELGDGRLHSCESVPFILATSPEGAARRGLRTNRMLQANGAPHQQLLVSLCQLMGVDTQVFGDPSAGVGPLPGLVG